MPRRDSDEDVDYASNSESELDKLDEEEEELEVQSDPQEEPAPEESEEEEPKEEEDDGLSRRLRHKRVNYNEDKMLEPLNNEISEEDESDEPKEDANDGEYNDGGAADKDDDDDFMEDSDGELRPKRPRRRGFIVKDDEDVDEDEEFDVNGYRDDDDGGDVPALKKRKRGRPRKRAISDDEAEDGEADKTLTIQDELRELQNDSGLDTHGHNSPVQVTEADESDDGEGTPVHRHLRRRKQVNYTLPPPILTDAQIEQMNSAGGSPRRRGGRFGGSAIAGPQVRRLFPTVGPFGGSEVTALYSSSGNGNGNGNGNPGASASAELTALGNLDSSDSEDDTDLYRSTDPNDTSKKSLFLGANDQEGKKKNTLADTDPLGIDTEIDFTAVGGLNNYIDQLKEMIMLPLKYPELYAQFGITPPRGVLFHGPPGTGKTLMARALAASASTEGQKITFFMRKGADCLSKWVGEAERHLRLLFEEAKEKQPSIIFFDEIDGLAPVRSSKQEQIHASIVSTLLALMDGMDNRGQVIVIGATNRPDAVDPALRRPGRFDREFYFPLPDEKARKEILQIHMRKWEHKMEPGFVGELARLTKGYGGADLRALCTESALNAMQRSYPQIYDSNEKLKINPSKVQVSASDFTRALGKIVPSSARAATSTVAAPLPEPIKPLLQRQVDKLAEIIDGTIPNEKEPSLLEESRYVDLTARHPDGGFRQQQLLRRLQQSRVYCPRFILSGAKGQGQRYVCAALLHHMEGFNVQTLDLAKLFSDPGMPAETVLINTFQELKRHTPSVLFIPDMLSFLDNILTVTGAALGEMIKSISPSDRILVLGMIEDSKLQDSHIDQIRDIFKLDDSAIHTLTDPTTEERVNYFADLWSALKMTPYDYNDLSVRPKRKLKKLPVVEMPKNDARSEAEQAKKEREQAKQDLQLKNTLKVKLAGLMDAFKARYKRFRRPVIDDAYLVHLFEPTPFPDAAYQMADNHMIKEVGTGRLFHNMDLEVIEERLWNGYYSEPKQFLQDIELILQDAQTTQERERIFKANEMYANAQVGIQDIEAQLPQLTAQWKEVRAREKKRIAEAKARAAEPSSNLEGGVAAVEEADGGKKVAGDAVEPDGFGTQEQAQAQLQVGQVARVANETDSATVEPVSISEPLAKKALAEEVAMDESKDEVEEVVREEEEAEEAEEEEEEEELPTPPEIIIDQVQLEQLKKHLIEGTEGYRVADIEKLDAKLVDLVWAHRLETDKASLISAMMTAIEQFEPSA